MDQKENLNSLEQCRRRLLFRAKHRGTYEMDLLIGKYAELHVPFMDLDLLKEFEHVMTLSDIDLTAWLSGSTSIPENAQCTVLMALRDFAQKHYYLEIKRG